MKYDMTPVHIGNPKHAGTTMAIIAPFRAIRYNPDKIEDVALVVAPPYDVISPEDQEMYHRKSPCNVIRLILGKESPEDTAADNRYVRAAKSFTHWQREGILKRDERPSLYVYLQEYSLEGGKRRITREGFVCLALLEEPGDGKILPHEKTLSGPKEDRLKLMRAAKANFSSIFSLYCDPHKKVERLWHPKLKEPPLVDIEDREGVTHRLWGIDDPHTIEAIAALLKDEQLFIADGHHRYETALTYRNESRARLKAATGRESFNYVMMYLTNLEHEDLTILPYHRMLHNLEGFQPETFLKRLKSFFAVEEFSFASADETQARRAVFARLKEKGGEETSFIMALPERKGYDLLTLKEESAESLSAEDLHPAIENLDVIRLEHFVFRKLLGMDGQSLQKQNHLVYVHTVTEGIELLTREGFQVAFFLNPTRPSQVKEVARAGQTMPQKSTYFYPKLLSGLALNLIDPAETYQTAR
jgi:uncharacterized protein (DUF1015 family)